MLGVLNKVTILSVRNNVNIDSMISIIVLFQNHTHLQYWLSTFFFSFLSFLFPLKPLASVGFIEAKTDLSLACYLALDSL